MEKTTNPTARRTSAIHLRAFPAQRDLIKQACGELNKKMTDFVLEAACREAEHVLCDRRYFSLDTENFDAFEKALNTPLNENQAVKQLLASSSPWEK